MIELLVLNRIKRKGIAISRISDLAYYFKTFSSIITSHNKDLSLKYIYYKYLYSLRTYLRL